MRRHTIVTAVFLWLMCFVIWITPIAEAVTCQALPYQYYLPIAQSIGMTSMGSFSIIRPEATTNILVNPSPQLATTNYTAVGGSIARSTTKQRRGAYSLAVTPTSGTADGAYYGTVSLTSGQSYTFSVDVWAALGVPIRIYFGSTAAAVLGTPTTLTGTGDWQRVEVTYAEVSTTTRRLYVVKNSSASTAVFYVDGLQLENLAYSTSYCDGNQQGCLWSAGKYTSTSTRSAQERSGGRLIDLESMNAYLVSQQGTGMPAFINSFTPYAAIDGAFYQRTSVKERIFTIALSVSGTTTADWHIKRQALIDLIKPNLVYPVQPFVLSYNGGGKRLDISCYYDGGMEMADGKNDIETIAIRCLAVDPYWKVDGNAGTALTVQSTIASASRILFRSSDGLWSMPHSGVTGTVFAIAQGLDGTVYVGGAFGGASGVSNTAGIAKYSLATNTFTAMGTGSAQDVYDINVAPNGDIWIVGSFLNAGGVAAADYVARWDGSAWNGVGTPPTIGSLGLPIRACFGIDGKFYLPTGGTSLQLWNGSAWSNLGLTNGTAVVAAVLAPDGTIIVAHNGTTMGGVSTPSGVARYTPSTGLFSAVGTTARVLRDVAFAPSGQLYGTGSGAVSNLYLFNGIDWVTVGAFGTGSTAGYTIAPTPSGSVFIGGDFGTVGTLTLLDRFVEWNGSVIIPPDIDLPSTATVYELKILSNGSLAVGYNTNGTATIPGSTTVVNNGSAETYPEITILGPSSGSTTIREIVNQTTKKTISMNVTINAGETLVLNLAPGAISFTSNFQGNMLPYVYAGSSLAGWSLAPGNNTIMFLSDSSSVVATMIWNEQCHSIDSSGV